MADFIQCEHFVTTITLSPALLIEAQSWLGASSVKKNAIAAALEAAAIAGVSPAQTKDELAAVSAAKQLQGELHLFLDFLGPAVWQAAFAAKVEEYVLAAVAAGPAAPAAIAW